MTVTYWSSFSKRKNSTKQPTSGTDVTVRLKEDCSIINPVFESATMPATANYIYVSEWGRYYFVTNVTYISNTTKLFSCEVDVLASYKSQISATKAMIMRASSNYNVWIPDNEVYVSTQKTFVRQVGAANVGFANATGVYLISVINEEGCATGFAAQYFANATSLQAFAQELMNSNFVQDVMQYSSNVSAGIVSLKWMPFNYSDIISASFTTLENFKVSNLPFTGSSGYRITGNAYFLDGAETITLPWRTDKDFRECGPYTAAKLLIPMYGFIDINTADLVGASSLYIQYRVDRSTGDVVVILNRDSAGEPIQTIQFNVGVEIPIATMTRNIGGALSAISGGINNAIGIAAGNYVGGTVGLISNAASFALNANGRSISYKGALDGKAATAYGDQFQLMYYVPHTLDPTNANFIATKGRPVQAVDTISSFSGYIQCENASVDNIGTPIEKDRINQYLNSGFFYE